MAFVLRLHDRHHVEGASGRWLERFAERMSPHWDVEVLTTCAAEPITWRDYHDPGPSEIGRVRLHRFRVDYTRCPTFADRLRAAALSPDSSPEIERRWLEEEGPYSSSLLRHLERRRADCDAFFFVGYASATTVFGLRRVADKAVLVPLASDEPRLGVASFRTVFEASRGFVFGSPEERDLVRSRFHITSAQTIAPTPGDPEAIDWARVEAAYLDVLRSVAS